MFELYKKVNKSIQYPKGAQKILENENPFLDGPCLLCVSAQDKDNKSLFGFTKMGARMARIRVKGNNGARISLDEIPVSFLSLKSDNEDREENNVEKFVEKYIKPLLIDKDGLAKSKEIAVKAIRNINIMSNCDGTIRATNIIKEIEKILIELNYNSNDIGEILSQISLISFQTEADLSNCQASIIDFHNLNDEEVEINPNNINDDMLSSHDDSRNGESVKKLKNRIEVLIDGEDSHYVSDYIETGEAMPVIVYTIVSSVLENSIDNKLHNITYSPLSIEELFEKAKDILHRIDNGEKKEDLIANLDSSLKYGGQITRLSDRELKLLDMQEQTVEAYDRVKRDSIVIENNEKRLKEDKEKMLQTAKEVCTTGNYYRVLEASGWQLNHEQEQVIRDSKTDKETIESQKLQIKRTQKMLKRTIEFADEVRNSVFGKIFFGKKIKQLPEGNEMDYIEL